MDRILIPDLPLRCRIGVSDQERAEPQDLVADIELSLDLEPAASSDDIGQTVNYQRVGEAMAEVATAQPRKLIETLAEDSARALLARFSIQAVRVRIKKPSAMANFGVPYAAVEIERRRDA